MRRQHGFTLVELLVVVAIIGVLAALLLPAIQAARESARNSACQNNLKQVGIGFTQHAGSHGFYPTGGWTYGWTGDPDRGYSSSQPGGWVYNVLSYVDQDALHQAGAGQAATQKMATMSLVNATPLPLFICPSRRLATVYPFNDPQYMNANLSPNNSVNKTDYAANGGTSAQVTGNNNPSTLAQGDSMNWPSTYSFITTATGIVFCRSQIQPAMVTDGLTFTFMVGEKYLEFDLYDTGSSAADNDSLFVGHDWDTIRWADPGNIPSNTPLQDTFPPGGVAGANIIDIHQNFGSAHAAGANFVFCDGAVHLIPFDVDPTVFSFMANRLDGVAVDMRPY